MRGSIEVIAGGMFSGKTEELLRRVRRELYAAKSVQLFKHALDERYAAESVVTHDRIALPCVPVQSSEELRRHVRAQTRVVGIDEANFFDDGLVTVVQQLADDGMRVMLAGLDMDFRRVPFGPMSALLSIADEVMKIRAVCITCGEPANYSYRCEGGDDVVQVGSSDAYEARCRTCFHMGTRICAVPHEQRPTLNIGASAL
ncbi:thymidine kinase [Candidatus Uhrbacteria bacterium RIFCSPLOWO2_01_FULL_53_9]|uniref:Thymidine kinase n=3 Tax=Candidatus Uhriibacteriota TaxID=1752732 RepID=A0A1F7UYN3_9BACT|nr:MAG: thymidine kinase [Candidatus Uhrbacteria bacterium RIFCSPHIGHO2_02_FULL_53_13]OGL83373.1 MAG: thymidine kinase [Candidatus Uhrbacteria bacterium RIFCSPLOWO2_01_FULL_53_9]OGL89154.1 MAG: thymidine kinase [Candidatus Uhrbacteria bacterium RIFCSPLOWO2_02_FULL_53_10]